MRTRPSDVALLTLASQFYAALRRAELTVATLAEVEPLPSELEELAERVFTLFRPRAQA